MFSLATDRCASLKEKSAEGAGFEPAARANRAPDFESGAFNQLSHPSIDFGFRNTKLQNSDFNKGRKQKQVDSFNPLNDPHKLFCLKDKSKLKPMAKKPKNPRITPSFPTPKEKREKFKKIAKRD